MCAGVVFSHMPRSKCAFRQDETLICASVPRPCRVAPPLASSGRFPAFSKMRKTQGPFAQKVFRPPAGAPRRRMCVVYCVLQTKTCLRAQNPRAFKGSREAAPGPPKRHPKRLPGARPPKRPPRGPQDGQSAFSIAIYRSKLASGLKKPRFSPWL